jgi:hypothetical protein
VGLLPALAPGVGAAELQATTKAATAVRRKSARRMVGVRLVIFTE